jgi:type II secretory pathway component PulK
MRISRDRRFICANAIRLLRNRKAYSATARAGYAIVAVLIVVVVLSLAAYRFGDYMMGEYRATVRIQQAAEVRALADGGIYYATGILDSPTAFTSILNSNPFDNSSVFTGQSIASGQGEFSLVGLDYSALDSSNQPTQRAGVMDECAKINLNSMWTLDTGGAGSKAALQTLNTNAGSTTATQATTASGATSTQGAILYNALMNFSTVLGTPSATAMSSSIVNSILDWIDVDENARDGGAETSYYQGLSPGYRAKNNLFTSVEELLFVQGVTPDLLFGTDRNRNGINDENASTFDPGWYPYLTVYSLEPNVTPSGTPKTYINNSTNLSTLYQNLISAGVNSDIANFLIAYQLYTPSTTAPPANATIGNAGSLSTAIQTALSASTAPTPKQTVPSLYSIIGAYVQVPGSKGQPDTYYPSPILTTSDATTYFPAMQQLCTTYQRTYLPGRINVNTAPQVVLQAIPGLATTDVQNLMAQRPTIDQLGSADPVFQSTIWLYTLANITPAQLVSAEQFITAIPYVYRIQSVGYFSKGGPQSRVEAVVDVSQATPRIMYYRDLTELGRAFNFNQ